MKRNTEIVETIREDTVISGGARYTYKLVVKELKRHFAPKLPRYAVLIEMQTSEGMITTADSGYIFVDMGKAIVFYERLTAHLCTPLNLPYVLEDSFV